MVKRVTVMIDEDIVRKLRNMQAKMIKESSKSVSFSQVLNEYLKKVI